MTLICHEISAHIVLSCTKVEFYLFAYNYF